MYLRRNNKTRSEVSFDEPLNIDWDGNELLLSDVLGTEDDIITKDLEANVDRKLLMRALQQLNEREKQIMELRFGLHGGEEKRKKMWLTCSGFLNLTYQDWKKEFLSVFEKNLIKWCNFCLLVACIAKNQQRVHSEKLVHIFPLQGDT